MKEEQNNHPIAIIGAGPAGLSAAIYTARAGIPTHVFGITPKVAGDYAIDNYFGFAETISGAELIERGRNQARRFGAEIHEERILGLHHGTAGGFKLTTEHSSYDVCTLILATGVARSKPVLHDIKAYEGHGVSYCVSCDGFFFRGKKVMVLGAGDFAASQALELLHYTPHVSICTQGKEPTIGTTFSERLRTAHITVQSKRMLSLEGHPVLTGVTYEDGSSEAVDGLFIAMGEASSLDFAYSLGVERKGNFLIVDADQKTNIPGVFAAGDCTGKFLQIAVAVGEGALAARSAINYIRTQCTQK